MTKRRAAKKEYPREVKDQIGQYLKGARRGSQKLIAEALDVSDRTLREWKRAAGFKRRGRRPLPKKLSEAKLVTREWRKQGFPGARPISQALPQVRVRFVQEMVRRLKLKGRVKKAKAREKNRTRIIVHKPQVYAGMDGATLQRGDDLVIVRDRGNLRTDALRCNGPLCSANVLTMLERMRKQGSLPLVMSTDNGSPLCCHEVQQYFEEHKVIHLRSLPRVAEHNCSCENAVRDIKALKNSGIELQEACNILNTCRKRRQLKWQTSLEVDKANPIPYNRKIRNSFYQAALLAKSEAVLGTKSGYERRMAERRAILETLERFEFITIMRGNQLNA